MAMPAPPPLKYTATIPAGTTFGFAKRPAIIYSGPYASPCFSPAILARLPTAAALGGCATSLRTATHRLGAVGGVQHLLGTGYNLRESTRLSPAMRSSLVVASCEGPPDAIEADLRAILPGVVSVDFVRLYSEDGRPRHLLTIEFRDPDAADEVFLAIAKQYGPAGQPICFGRAQGGLVFDDFGELLVVTLSCKEWDGRLRPASELAMAGIAATIQALLAAGGADARLLEAFEIKHAAFRGRFLCVTTTSLAGALYLHSTAGAMLIASTPGAPPDIFAHDAAAEGGGGGGASGGRGSDPPDYSIVFKASSSVSEVTISTISASLVAAVTAQVSPAEAALIKPVSIRHYNGSSGQVTYAVDLGCAAGVLAVYGGGVVIEEMACIPASMGGGGYWAFLLGDQPAGFTPGHSSVLGKVGRSLWAAGCKHRGVLEATIARCLQEGTELEGPLKVALLEVSAAVPSRSSDARARGDRGPYRGAPGGVPAGRWPPATGHASAPRWGGGGKRHHSDAPDATMHDGGGRP